MSTGDGQGDQAVAAAGSEPSASLASIIARATATVQELHGRDGLHAVNGKLRRGTLAAAASGYTFALIDPQNTVVNNLTEEQARAWLLEVTTDTSPETPDSLE